MMGHMARAADGNHRRPGAFAAPGKLAVLSALDVPHIKFWGDTALGSCLQCLQEGSGTPGGCSSITDSSHIFNPCTQFTRIASMTLYEDYLPLRY